MNITRSLRNFLLLILIWTERVNQFPPGFYIIDAYSQFMNDLSDINNSTRHSKSSTSTQTPATKTTIANTEIKEEYVQVKSPRAKAIAKVLNNVCHDDLKKSIQSECFLTVNSRFDINTWTQKEIEGVLEENQMYSTMRADHKSLLTLQSNILRLLDKLKLFANSDKQSTPNKQSTESAKKDSTCVEVTIYNSDTRHLWRRSVDADIFNEYKSNRTDLFDVKKTKNKAPKDNVNQKPVQRKVKVQNKVKEPCVSQCHCSCCQSKAVGQKHKLQQKEEVDKKQKEMSKSQKCQPTTPTASVDTTEPQLASNTNWMQMYSNYTIDYVFGSPDSVSDSEPEKVVTKETTTTKTTVAQKIQVKNDTNETEKEVVTVFQIVEDEFDEILEVIQTGKEYKAFI